MEKSKIFSEAVFSFDLLQGFYFQSPFRWKFIEGIFAIAPSVYSQDINLLLTRVLKNHCLLECLGLEDKNFFRFASQRERQNEEYLHIYIFLFFFLGSNGDWTQGLVHSRQALYHWAKFPTFYLPKKKKKVCVGVSVCHWVCVEVREQLRRFIFPSIRWGPGVKRKLSGFEVDCFTLWTIFLARDRGKKKPKKQNKETTTKKKERQENRNCFSFCRPKISSKALEIILLLFWKSICTITVSKSTAMCCKNGILYCFIIFFHLLVHSYWIKL